MWFFGEHAKRNLQRVQFRVGGDRKNRSYAANGRVLYQQLPAANVRDEDLSFPGMAGAIVIIGTSHKGSEEYHSTPLGQMPGPAVHANIMLQLQIGPVAELPSWIQVIIKGVLCLGLAFIHARVYVYNIARAKLGGLQGIAHHLRYFVFAAVLTLVGTIIYYAIVVRCMVPDAVAVMGPIVVVCAELLYGMVKLVEKLIDKKGRQVVDTLRGFR